MARCNFRSFWSFSARLALVPPPRARDHRWHVGDSRKRSLLRLPGQVSHFSYTLQTHWTVPNDDDWVKQYSTIRLPTIANWSWLVCFSFPFLWTLRFTYDPFSQSPNDNPEAEVSLVGGDYVLVWGTMDEDGFYDGELLDGRRGLVPSNFVQRLQVRLRSTLKTWEKSAAWNAVGVRNGLICIRIDFSVLKEFGNIEQIVVLYGIYFIFLSGLLDWWFVV